MQLSWHSDDHMIIIRVEVFSFLDVDAVGGLEMVTSLEIVNIIYSSWS